MRDQLRAYAEALPPQTAAAPGAVGVLALSCGGLPFFEDTDVARCLPNAAVSEGQHACGGIVGYCGISVSWGQSGHVYAAAGGTNTAVYA